MSTRPYFDPTIPRKSNMVDSALSSDLEGIPLPSIVEISESGTCNRVCSFCPRSAADYDDRKEFIEIELLGKLATEVAGAGFEGLFLFSGFSEPMIDKAIYEKVKLVRNLLPNNRIEMVTNGDVLDISRLQRLIESGLSTLLISVYDGPKEAEVLTKMCIDAGMTEDQFVIRKRYLTEDKDFGITISNRAGMLENAEYSRPALTEALDRPCYYPSYLFFMDYQGDVLMCPHDWGKKKIIGNLKFQTFSQIWTSRQAIGLRKQLNRKNRQFSPCNVCDVQGTYIGKKHAELWAEQGNYELIEAQEQ